MEYTERDRQADEAAIYDHLSAVAAIRRAVKDGRTWDSNHPDNIRRKIAKWTSRLKEATTQ